MTNPYQSIVYKNKTTHHHEIKKSKILTPTFNCSDYSLADAFMQAKFQIKIRKYSFAAKVAVL